MFVGLHVCVRAMHLSINIMEISIIYAHKLAKYVFSRIINQSREEVEDSVGQKSIFV